MKFTNNDLAKAMGLEIGDRVRVRCADGSIYIYKLNSDYSLSYNRAHIHLDSIIELDYEIIPRTKKVGELICRDISCADCPLRAMDCGGERNDESLYDKLECTFADINDKEIYDIVKSRLDKEAE